MFARRFCLPFLSCLLLFGTDLPAAEPGMSLIGLPEKLGPASTIEVAFTHPMVSADAVGKVAATPPVTVIPATPFTFTWLDEKRGVLQPTAALPLATTFQIAVRDGLQTAAGAEFQQGLVVSVATPPMELRSARRLDYYSREDVPVTPSFTLLFNVNVSPETVAPFLKFVDSSGAKVDAAVERTDETYSYRHPGGGGSDPRGLAPWDEQYRLAMDPEAKVTLPPKNQVTVRPSQPLPPGANWRLKIGEGIPSVDGTTKTLRSEEIEIGTVRAFTVLAAHAENYLNSGRRIVIHLSKPVAKDVTPQNLARWVDVTPAPRDLTAAVDGTRLALTGSFALGEKVKVTVDPGLPCAVPMLLAQRFTKELSFERIPPRLYLEETQTHQLSSGRRQFQLLGVNVPRVRVTAKLFQTDTAAHALKAWQSYYRWNREEIHARVEGEELPGVEVFGKEYELASTTDETSALSLNWDEILGPGKTGVVLLTAEQIGEIPAGAKRPGTQAIVQVTDIGLVWKTTKAEFFFYAFSMATGQPLSGAKLAALNEAGATIAEVETDANGVARMLATSDAKWMLARHAADLHLVPFQYRDELPLYRFRLGADEETEESENFSYSGDSRDRKAVIFTERGVYRPGETVHLKGVVREFSSGASRIPEGKRLSLVVTDSKDRRVHAETVTVSETGSFAVDVGIRPTAALGRYEVMLSATEGVAADESEYEHQWGRHSFLVEEFKPNSFEVTVRGPASYLGTQAIELPVQAQYYMGKPLSKARMNWTLRAEDAAFTPAGFGGFVFCDALSDYRLGQALKRVGDFSTQGEEELSPEGKMSIVEQVPLNIRAPQPRSAQMICEITDVNQQTVSAEHRFTVDSSEFYLGLAKPPTILREGEELRLPIVAVRRDGSPLEEKVPVMVRITRLDWQTNRVEAAGRAAAYQSEPVLTLKSEQHVQTQMPVKEGKAWAVAETGTEAVATFTGEAGQYLVEAGAQDAEGREVLTSVNLFIYGKGETVWNYSNPFQVELVADKATYRTGDTATLLVKTPISGAALVTVERENVRRSFITRLEGNAPSVEIPLEEDDAPNVFVSVMLLRGAVDSPKKWKMPEYRIGYAKLMVERPEAKLSVYVRAKESAYRPGDTASLEVEVLDHTGRSVEGSEVTLYAVDEGILSLTGYETPNLLSHFQQPRGLRVRTGLTLPDLLEENPEEASFGNKGYLIGDKGGPDRIRKHFLACAFWAANLKTGADGKLSTDFAVPDGLTRYRVMAVVHTARDQFGTAESAFEVNKPVMIEPAPPRFANVGDKLQLRAVLHNTTAAAGLAKVKLVLDGTAAGENLEREVELPAEGTVAVDFPVTFQEIGEAKWTWSVDFTGGDQHYRDAAVTTFQVNYPTPARREVHLRRIVERESDLLSEIPPHLADGRGTVRVSVTSSRAIELREAMESLLHYPYGCVEQTTSSTLPWMTLDGLRGTLPELQRTDGEIAMMIERGVNRLLAMQTSSGGLSYWPGGREPILWGSAYGGFGLALAKKQGHPVPEAEFERLCDYLRRELRGVSGEEEFNGHALALYTLALAGHAEPAYQERLFQQRERMSMEDRALLALAISESGGSAEMIKTLLQPGGPELANTRWFGSESRQVATQLLAWCHYAADRPEVEALVTRLVGHRSTRDWLTTQGNAWALLAMSSYITKVEGARGPAAGVVAWGDQQQDFALEQNGAVAERTWSLASGMEGKALRVTNPQGQPLYAEVRIESRPQLVDQPRQDHGFTVHRKYSRVLDDGTTEPLVDATVGDRVLVTLNVSVAKGNTYIAIEDPLPSVFEAINPEFKTQQTVEVKDGVNTWFSDFRELRKDRALFFRDHVSAGTYQIQYLARVCAAGDAIAPSTKVEAMYEPTCFGLSATDRLTALPLK